MKKEKIWHVYYGTRGTAGSYVDRLQKACHKVGLDSYAYVSARYRYKTAKTRKIFFPLSEVTERRNPLIMALRYAEVAWAYKIIFFGALLVRPVVHLNLNDDLALTYSFFRMLKAVGLKVYVTCHDVLSHHKGITPKRMKMYRAADRLIVHSAYAQRTLGALLDEKNRAKIICFPFPSSPYEEILSSRQMEQARQRLGPVVGEKGSYYLFIGIVRQSKGIDTLLDAWQEAAPGSKKKLVIAGKWSGAAREHKERARALPNCVLVDRYLGDEEFIYLIRNARFAILPYRDYSHSAVLYACAWNDAAVIISDVELFTELLPDYKATFPAAAGRDLAALIKETEGWSDDRVADCAGRLADAVKGQNKKLERELSGAYGKA